MKTSAKTRLEKMIRGMKLNFFSSLENLLLEFTFFFFFCRTLFLLSLSTIFLTFFKCMYSRDVKEKYKLKQRYCLLSLSLTCFNRTHSTPRAHSKNNAFLLFFVCIVIIFLFLQL